VDSHYGGLVRITGENAWMGRREGRYVPSRGAINNVKAFIDSIHAGKYLNNAEQAVRKQFDGDSWAGPLPTPIVRHLG